MSQTITVSDAAYANLLSKAQAQGYDSVETLIERAYAPENEKNGTHAEQSDAPAADVFDRIDAFRKQMSEKYGTFPDSTTFIREDRER